MASPASDIPALRAASPDQSHTIMTRSSYERDDWRRLHLNDAVEDALAKILRFGFDIDHVDVKPTTADALRDQIITWAQHIAHEIPGYRNWQEIDDLTLHPVEYDLAHLKNDDVKDPGRIASDLPSLPTRNLARYYPQVAGREAHSSLTPETAGVDHAHKLTGRSEAELDQLFGNIAAYARSASFADKNDAIVSQAVEAARDWQSKAVANHRPICTGTSGHMLSYARIFLDNIALEACSSVGHPSLEQLRLTLLAALIGFNQLHSYDECMVASHGLTHGGVTLEYHDRVGYRDIIDSSDPFVRQQVGKPLISAMVAIGKQVMANFKELEDALTPPLPDWRPLVVQWFAETTGREFPELD